jgi:16S rRNA (guanine527-N7)-methyltransferase
VTTNEAVTAALEDARRFGFLGPAPVGDQIEHSSVFAQVLEEAGIGPAVFLDLGSGGGLPGLVLADRWSEQRGTLLDASARRTAFLRRAVMALGWDARVSVLEGRAERLARNPELRCGFPLVVARSFASPALTAEIGGAFVAIGGALAVSEPDDSEGRERWPAARLRELGMAAAEMHRGPGVGIGVLRRTDALPDRWPRGVGTPAKRPLW